MALERADHHETTARAIRERDGTVSRILGIETSCDETAAGVVEGGRRVLANAVASQHELHEAFGGVVPEIASRAHAERIRPILRGALDESGLSLNEIDAVAVGHRPGLIGSLLVGVSAAKALAWSLGIPLIGIDHVRAHLYAGLLDREEDPAGAFPALGLVISGGHSSIYACGDVLSFELLGKTIDDAVGEAFDKVASMLGLPHPGGPKVDALAQKGDDRAHDFPVSRLEKGSLDFSFSGLKTAVLYAIRGNPARDADGTTRFERSHEDLTEQQVRDVCASFQRAAVRAIILKLNRAVEQLDERGRPPKALLVGGGVCANSRVRAELTGFATERGLELRLPPIPLCLDNAAMIAGLAHHRLARGESDGLSLAAAPTGTAS